MAIAPVNLNIPLPGVPTSPRSAAPNASEAFSAAFTEAVNKVEEFQSNAKTSVDKFLSGEGEELHQVALKAQQAELSFDLFLQVRNKVIAAYQEVMRMQV